MAKNCFCKIKNRLLLILLALLFACTSAFILTACGDSSEDFTEKDYSYEWTDDAKIVNGSFEFGTHGVELSNYPYVSANNWSLATDNSAQSSLINSGIINTTSEAWAELLKTLYNDSDFISYAEKKWGFEVSDIKSAHTDWSDDQVKNHIIETYFNDTNFANPKTHVDAEGSKVYMLNNYPSVSALGGIGQGTAQKLSSSTTINLEKGSYGKITVFVKTVNLANLGANPNGANIRLANTVGTTKQADYRISSINTQTSGVPVDANGWAKYQIFVKADDFIDNSVVVELGLGYGNGASTNAKDYCEGTVYFDDVTFEEVDKTAYENAKTTGTFNVYNYNESVDEHINVLAQDKTEFVFSLDNFESLNTFANTYFNPISQAPVGAKNGTKGSIVSESNSDTTACPYTTGNNFKVELDKASYTLSYGSATTPIATLDKETYANITFFIKADLGEFSSKQIAVYVYDVYENLTTHVVDYAKAPRITINPDYTAETPNGWTKVSFFLSNNFPEKDAEGLYKNYAHSFFFEVVIGPTDVENAKTIDFASGSVIITKPLIATGKTYTYARENYVTDANSNIISYDQKPSKNENKTDNNNYYSLLYSVADAKEALYYAYSSDFVEDTSSTTYPISVAPSAIGSIVGGPANVDGFTGVSSDHGYIKSSSTNYLVNERNGNGTTDGVAGVINTKYYSAYTDYTQIKDALNHTGAEDLQPLMIYNKTSGSYGFIGESLPLAINTSILISIKVRVVGDANAYIYLIDTSTANKQVMSIEVPVNTDGVNYLTGDDIITSTGKLMFKVSSDMMRADEDGWLTVKFYLAAGNKAKNFRVELWNGARDGSDNSQGFVFFDQVVTSGSFTESSTDNYLLAFNEGALLEASIYDKGVVNQALLYKRELDETEIAYNNDSDRKNDAVSYPAKYVWVQTPTTLYAIYNTLECDAVDPYAAETEEDEEASGCAAERDPATFWLQFSTILLGVALVFALIALIIKGVIAKKKANANDAKSHYNVSSRYKTNKAKKEDKAEDTTEVENETPASETESEDVLPQEETASPSETESETENANPEEITLDEYVYGDVQDFGSDIETNQETETDDKPIE